MCGNAYLQEQQGNSVGGNGNSQNPANQAAHRKSPTEAPPIPPPSGPPPGVNVLIEPPPLPPGQPPPLPPPGQPVHSRDPRLVAPPLPPMAPGQGLLGAPPAGMVQQLLPGESYSSSTRDSWSWETVRCSWLNPD